MSDAVLAPGGWGWPSGHPLTPFTIEALPDLPMLRLLPNKARKAALLAMLREHPQLWDIRPNHLHEKYRTPRGVAAILLQKAKEIPA